MKRGSRNLFPSRVFSRHANGRNPCRLLGLELSSLAWTVLAGEDGREALVRSFSSVSGTVELNTSFYHLPNPETFTKWPDQAAEGFRYAVKAPLFITHRKRCLGCSEPVGERDVWCYLNNDIDVHAIDDALTLRAMIGQAAR